MDQISEAFQKIALLSLSNDLRRITTSIQRNSLENSKRFSKEARHWIPKKVNDPYLAKLLKKISRLLDESDDLEKAENCLMYSVLLQNKAASQK